MVTTSVYKIYCKDSSVTYFYIGSTTNIKVKRAIHKRNLHVKPESILSKTINANGGWENWHMDVIEIFDCNNRKEAIQREHYWYKLINSSFFPQNSSEIPQNSLIFPQNLLNFPQNSLKNDEVIQTQPSISELDCIYCKKHFSRKDNLKRHLQICKSKQIFEEQIANNKLILTNPVNPAVMTPNSLTAYAPNVLANTTANANSNSMNTNSHNNTIITNNITNPVTIIPLGQENLVEFFTDEEQLRILKKMFGCFIYLIEYVHFSGKFPQFANMRITNLRSNTAYVYDECDKKFVAHDQNEVIAEVISERLMDITNFFDNVKDKLSEKEVTKITELINDLEEQRIKYKEYLRKVKFMMYNKRHMVNVQE
jgi:hypothetical protein